LKYSVKSPQKGALTRFLSTFASMKTLTDTEYIHALIAEGEHQQQDFKFEISDARKIAKTLSAFANTDGGKLLIGVKDNGKIAGVRSDEEQYMIEAAAELYCSPEVNYIMQTYLVEGRSVREPMKTVMSKSTALPKHKTVPTCHRHPKPYKSVTVSSIIFINIFR
jgi:hypothetical protein